MKLTKCITTIGPASFDINIMEKLVQNGADCFRINMSHGSHDSVLELIKDVEKLRIKTKNPLPILFDTKGPEIRSGCFKDDCLQVNKNDTVILEYKKEILGYRIDKTTITFSIDYHKINQTVANDDIILIDDGKLKLIVDSISSNQIQCTARNDHLIKNRRGVNLPGKRLLLDFISAKDKSDITFAVKNNLDYLAASFVQSKDDLIELKQFIQTIDPKSRIKIISKVESHYALVNLDEIINHSDGIMFARGDLGVDIPKWEVPGFQIKVLHHCREKRKLIIVATQMLETMTTNFVPTRAEVTDVFWACLLGASCTMLSAESASGDFPVESITMMNNILIEAEKNKATFANNEKLNINDEKYSISKDIYNIKNFEKDAGIFLDVCNSDDDFFDLVNNLASAHKGIPIFLTTTNKTLYHQVNLLFGVRSILLPAVNNVKSSDIGNLIKKYYPSYNIKKLYYFDIINHNSQVINFS